ncbi:hypothetical protein D3C71_2053120 [compost metagenome]
MPLVLHRAFHELKHLMRHNLIALPRQLRLVLRPRFFDYVRDGLGRCRFVHFDLI